MKKIIKLIKKLINHLFYYDKTQFEKLKNFLQQ
jgi:hypothetical protein